MMGKIKHVAYDDRTDLDKLQSQWRKIKGIFQRKKEWSAAIVRAATAAEIAANISVRKRFEADSEFSAEFIDCLLVWANGLDGKLNKLILPSEPDGSHRQRLIGMKPSVQELNKRRNDIVHRGGFSNRAEAKEYVTLAGEIATALVQQWEPTFALQSPWSAKQKKVSGKHTVGTKSRDVKRVRAG